MKLKLWKGLESCTSVFLGHTHQLCQWSTTLHLQQEMTALTVEPKILKLTKQQSLKILKVYVYKSKMIKKTISYLVYEYVIIFQFNNMTLNILNI